MNVSSQELAGLANHAYKDLAPGQRSPQDEEVYEMEGVAYRVLEHVSNERTGYQGTVYQRVESGQIVVAHRGTEQAWKDGVIADGGMVGKRGNPQADDAVALTGRALEYARDIEAVPGMEAGKVLVTGHSLGGTLAQVSAHHYDLPGETFNAYGAASLDRRIPDGPNGRVVNHVMAADAVSAASPHYGEVRLYATEKEISVLNQAGYNENRLLDLVTPDSPLVAAGRSLDSHKMENFLSRDAQGNARTSVLADPAARERASGYERMIDSYRDDLEALRRGVTLGARGPYGMLKDGIDEMRGPVPAGDPARREEQERPRQGASLDSAAQGELGSREEHVGKLLDAARLGSPESVRVATQELHASGTGQAWQRQADMQAQQLVQREMAQQQGARQHEAVRAM